MVLPSERSTPIIMVGPGTGVAAFRAFIQFLGVKEDDDLASAPELVLVFGCRSRGQDFYYEDEWKAYKNLKVITAFSRDQSDGSKQYVQHVVRQQENA
jgi:NADPH-ferrihemoprotein reductase